MISLESFRFVCYMLTLQTLKLLKNLKQTQSSLVSSLFDWYSVMICFHYFIKHCSYGMINSNANQEVKALMKSGHNLVKKHSQLD